MIKSISIINKNIFINKTKAWFTKVIIILFLSGFANFSCHGQEFTIPVFPDTQGEIQRNPDMFFSQLNWIKHSQDSLNIPIVLHVGDIVNFNNYNQWEIASKGFEILDKADKVYVLAVGNHDNASVRKHSRSRVSTYVNAKLRITDKFNSYFPVYRFPAQRGRFEPGKSDNAYYTFRRDRLNWLVLTLEFCPRRGAVNWAKKVVENHPSYNVIILTHYFLREDSSGNGIVGQTNAGYGDLSPQQVNDLLVKKYKNIVMVISGHTNFSAWKIIKGEKGNKVYAILQDYQGKKNDSGAGYLRLITIKPKAGTISAKMYSPYYDKTIGGVTTFSFSNVKFVRGFPND